MFYTEFEAIINAVRKGGLSGEKLIDTIISQIDSRKIYDSDDILSSDIYFTLMHYASGEEQITDAEWVYFLQCLKEKEVILCMIRMRKWQEDYKC